MKTMAEHNRRARYRSRRALARATAARARENTLLLTNGDTEMASKAYHKTLWSELQRLLHEEKESTP